MTGVITKRHFIQIAKEFGILTALRVVISRKRTALQILMEMK